MLVLISNFYLFYYAKLFPIKIYEPFSLALQEYLKVFVGNYSMQSYYKSQSYQACRSTVLLQGNVGQSRSTVVKISLLEWYVIDIDFDFKIIYFSRNTNNMK